MSSSIVIRYYVDDRGFPRAEATPPWRLLGAFLEGDVQSSVATCDMLLGEIEKIVQEKGGNYSSTGNAHELTMDATSVSIENIFVAALGRLQLPLTDFRNELMAWRDLIARVRP